MWLFLVEEYRNSPPTLIKYESFFPERVYHCPCLKHTKDEIFNADIRSYSEIILAISECFQSDTHVLWLRVEEKTNCLFSCQPHLVLALLSKARFDCTFLSKKDLIFDCLRKRHCKSGVRHYWQKLCNI